MAAVAPELNRLEGMKAALLLALLGAGCAASPPSALDVQNDEWRRIAEAAFKNYSLQDGT